MAWEMQHNMFSRIAPSILAHLEGNCDGEQGQREWLLERLEEHGADVWAKSSLDSLIDSLCVYVADVATTDNGGHEFYVDSEGYTTIPWCSDDELLTFYG